jgi:hypothetical protein
MSKPEFMLDPEDDIIFPSTQELDDLVESFTIIGLDANRSAYNDYDYDSDNYGYDY